MFGKNPLRPQSISDGTSLVVQEIFYTIQGEGPLAGTPAAFVRLWGCNLACKFCDTDFESNAEQRSLDSIIEQIIAMPFGALKGEKLVVLTGGEPFRQNFLPLVIRLNSRGYRVQVETAGSLWLPGTEDRFDFESDPAIHNSIVVSPKTPKLHKNIPVWATAWKYVLGADNISPVDGLPTDCPQPHGGPVARPAVQSADRVYIQPRDDYDAEKNWKNIEAARDVCLKYNYKLSLQQHKIIKLP